MVHVKVAQFEANVAPGETLVFDRPFGTYLAPGVHYVAMSAYAGNAEIWLKV
jgi:hypothetical protein